MNEETIIVRYAGRPYCVRVSDGAYYNRDGWWFALEGTQLARLINDALSAHSPPEVGASTNDGTPARPSSRPTPDQHATGGGDGQRRLTREVEFVSGGGTRWRAVPDTDGCYRFTLYNADGELVDAWRRQHPDDAPEYFLRAMFAAEDALLVEHPADATVIVGRATRDINAGEWTPADAVAWTLNGETTDNPDGRTLLHGAPVCPSAAEIVETLPAPEPAQTLAPWQERALSVWRKIGLRDDEIFVSPDRVGWRGLQWCIDSGGTSCGWPWSERTEDPEALIRDELRALHARIGEVLGDE